MKKRILSFILVLGLLALMLTGCTSDSKDSGSSTKTAKARTLEEIKKDGKIRIGVFSDKNPFGYVDENGKVQGYDIYFAKRIAKDLLGSEDAVEFVYVEAASRVEYLQSGKVDITLANFTVTEERSEKVDFALPYMKVALGVVSPDSELIKSVDDLDGKNLIVVKGTTAETYFSDYSLFHYAAFYNELICISVLAVYTTQCCFIICMEELFLAQCLDFLIEPV